jgi:hypothetical protein
MLIKWLSHILNSGFYCTLEDYPVWSTIKFNSKETRIWLPYTTGLEIWVINQQRQLKHETKPKIIGHAHLIAASSNFSTTLGLTYRIVTLDVLRENRVRHVRIRIRRTSGRVTTLLTYLSTTLQCYVLNAPRWRSTQFSQANRMSRAYAPSPNKMSSTILF